MSHSFLYDMCGSHRKTPPWKNIYLFLGVITYVLCVLYSQDLFPEVLKVIKCWLCGNGVHQSKSLAILHVQVPHSCELFLEKTKTRGRSHQQTVCISSVVSIWYSECHLLFQPCRGFPAYTAAHQPRLAVKQKQRDIYIKQEGGIWFSTTLFQTVCKKTGGQITTERMRERSHSMNKAVSQKKINTELVSKFLFWDYALKHKNVSRCKLLKVCHTQLLGPY